jgi:hypothetical protein
VIPSIISYIQSIYIINSSFLETKTLTQKEKSERGLGWREIDFLLLS